jgi:serine/threonine-protein kinase
MPRTETTTTTPPANTKSQTQPSNRNVTVSVKGEEDVFIGDDYTTPPAPTTSTTPSRTATTTRTTSTPSQPRTQTTTSTPSQPRTQTTASAPSTPPAPTTQTTSGGNKTARIRYVVPPIGQPMNLKIEVTDTSGKREIMNRQVKGGDSVSATASYSNECMVSIYLGGQSVWQEKYR